LLLLVAAVAIAVVVLMRVAIGERTRTGHQTNDSQQRAS
jgi:hypothetical protein